MGRTLALAALLLWPSVAARGEPVHGRLELQAIYAQDRASSFSAALDARRRSDLLGDLRLTWSPHQNRWSADIAYVVGFDAGDTPRFTARQAAAGLFPPAPPARWADLTNRFVERMHLTATQRLDRLSVGYTGAHVALRLGRQALSWGAGLVFRPMDLFDPFAPESTDTEYKPGADMLYGQYLFANGADVQLAAVPRPARRGGGLTEKASSFALHLRVPLGPLQTTWLLARDHGDIVAGVGLNGALGGATWNAELVPTFVSGGGTYTSALVNISNAGMLAGRAITYFAEYYRNGFGLGGHYALSDLPLPLRDRLVRGQLFNTGRNHLAAGAMVQVSPLLQIDPTVIVNLNDGSLFGFAQLTYSLRENLNLVVGGQVSLGPARTEFGGIPLSGQSAPFLGRPANFFVQLRRYF